MQQKWTCRVIVVSVFGPRTVKWERTFKSLSTAYLLTRFVAVWIDLRLPYCDGELGVDWEIRAAETAHGETA